MLCIHTYIHAYIHTYIRAYVHTYIHKYIHCRALFGLKLLLPSWCRGVGIGARQGQRWVREGENMCESGFFPIHGSSRDPVRIQSAPILHFLTPLLASRDPVGTESGTNFAVFGTTFGPVGKQLKSPKNVPKPSIFFDQFWRLADRC